MLRPQESRSVTSPFFADDKRTGISQGQGNLPGVVLNQPKNVELLLLSDTEQWDFLSAHCASYPEILNGDVEAKQNIINALSAYVRYQTPSALHRTVALTTLALLRAPDENGDLNRQLHLALSCLTKIDHTMASMLKITLLREKRIYLDESLFNWATHTNGNSDLLLRYEPRYPELPLWMRLMTLCPGVVEAKAKQRLDFNSRMASDFEQYPSWGIQLIRNNVAQLSAESCEELIFYYLQMLEKHAESRTLRNSCYEAIYALMTRIPDEGIHRLKSKLYDKTGKNLLALLLIDIRMNIVIDR